MCLYIYFDILKADKPADMEGEGEEEKEPVEGEMGEGEEMGEEDEDGEDGNEKKYVKKEYVA